MVKSEPRHLEERILFGGSFDPPHKGHLEILVYLRKKFPKAKIELVPAYFSPFKVKAFASSQDRLFMIDLLLGDSRLVDSKDKIFLRSWELESASPSYTYQTCRFLREKFPQSKISIALGMDTFLDLEHWCEVEELLTYHYFYFYPRENLSIKNIKKKERDLQKKWGNKFLYSILEGTTLVSCSSSQIRFDLGKAKDVRKYLTPLVAKYIQEKKIYSF